VEKMLKQGVPRAKVEKVLTAALLAHMKKQMKRIHHGIQQLVRP